MYIHSCRSTGFDTVDFTELIIESREGDWRRYPLPVPWLWRSVHSVGRAVLPVLLHHWEIARLDIAWYNPCSFLCSECFPLVRRACLLLEILVYQLILILARQLPQNEFCSTRVRPREDSFHNRSDRVSESLNEELKFDCVSCVAQVKLTTSMMLVERMVLVQKWTPWNSRGKKVEVFPSVMKHDA